MSPPWASRSTAPRITEPLLESELFGHENGAFTGAIGLKKGKLENVSSSGVALGTGEENHADDLPPGLGQGSPAAVTSIDYHATLEQTKRELIVRAFELAGNSHAGAARLLGVHPNYLHRLMRKCNLRAVIAART